MAKITNGIEVPVKSNVSGETATLAINLLQIFINDNNYNVAVKKDEDGYIRIKLWKVADKNGRCEVDKDHH